jgi:hypothetical protein
LKLLEYDLAFACAFELAQGDTVAITAFHQWPTYVDLYVGIPTADDNDRFISDARKKAAHHTGRQHVHVMSPARRKAPTELEPNGELLPPVTCAVSLEALEKGLTVVWFQEQYAFAPDAEVATALRALDFRLLAADEPL